MIAMALVIAAFPVHAGTCESLWSPADSSEFTGQTSIYEGLDLQSATETEKSIVHSTDRRMSARVSLKQGDLVFAALRAPHVINFANSLLFEKPSEATFFKFLSRVVAEGAPSFLTEADRTALMLRAAEIIPILSSKLVAHSSHVVIVSLHFRTEKSPEDDMPDEPGVRATVRLSLLGNSWEDGPRVSVSFVMEAASVTLDHVMADVGSRTIH